MSLRSLLPQAIRDGDLETLNSLIAANVDLNGSVCMNSGTPLTLAILHSQASVVEKLLEGGAEINQLTRVAISSTLLEECLGPLVGDIVAQANPFYLNCITALHIASLQGHTDIVKILVSHGATTSKTDRYGNAALVYGCLAGHLDVVKYFLENVCKSAEDIDCQGDRGISSCMMAAYGGHFEILKLLADAGGSLHLEDQMRRNVLHWASAKCPPKVIQYLKDKSVRYLMDTSQYKMSPLVTAVECGNLEAIDELMLYGGGKVELNWRGFQGRGLLHYVAAQGNLDMCRKMLECGIDVNKTCDLGWTALSIAVCRQHVNIVRVLVDAGIDVNLPQPPYQTIMDLAVKTGDLEIVNILKHGTDMTVRDILGQTYLIQAITQHKADKEIVDAVIGAGCDVNAYDEGGRTALFHAVQGKRSDLCHLLLDRGASTNIPNGHQLPLHAAVISDNLEMTRLLIQHGAALNAKDHKQMTPLDHFFVIGRCRRSKSEMLSMLLLGGGRCSDMKLYQTAAVRDSFSRTCNGLVDNILPLKLSYLCRTQINEILGSSQRRKVYELPLPVPIKDFLAFQIFK